MSAKSSSCEPGLLNAVQPKVRFDYAPTEIKEICQTALSRAEREIDKVARMSHSLRTFNNTVAQLDRIDNSLSEQIGPLHLLRIVSPSKRIQNAAKWCEDQVGTYAAKMSTRADVYQALKAVQDQIQTQHVKLDVEDSKLLEESVRSYIRSGAALPEAERKLLTELAEKVSTLENSFSYNIDTANDTIELTHSELDGLDEQMIGDAGLKKTAKGTYVLPLLNSSYVKIFLENAKSAEARRKVATSISKVAAAVNTPILEEVIAIRHRMANMLGFPTHAAYQLDDRMAKTVENVDTFLSDLFTRLKPKAEADLAEMLALKKKDDPSATKIDYWDRSYYANQIMKNRYTVDSQEVREYFPVDHVIQTVLEIYQKMLSVKFVEIPPQASWAEEIRLFEIRDAGSGSLIAHFYADLYPRQNKYKHFCASDFLHGYQQTDGTYRTPVAAIVGNFPKARGKTPALLPHDDVETFFHEFGHIMHQTLTQARYGAQAGTNVRTDFVESPSQMLENWVWDKAVLKQLSKHYKTGKPLSDELIDRMIAARHANEGMQWIRQVFFATLDMRYHSLGERVDTTAVYHDLMRKIHLTEPIEGSQPQATFGHLMGYDAGYYGYLWSKVYAEDMFTVFEQAGLTSPIAGARYRKWILQPGGTLEPWVLLQEFLGREPNKDAFYRSLGIP